MNKVMIFKLVTGENFIAQYKVDGNKYKIKRPMAMMLTKTADGKGAIMDLMQFILGSDPLEWVELPMGHVVMKVTPQVEVLNEYNTKFGSNISIHQSIPKV